MHATYMLYILCYQPIYVPLGGMPHGGMPPEAPYARYNLGQQNTTGMYLIHFKATFGISREGLGGTPLELVASPLRLQSCGLLTMTKPRFA